MVFFVEFCNSICISFECFWTRSKLGVRETIYRKWSKHWKRCFLISLKSTNGHETANVMHFLKTYLLVSYKACVRDYTFIKEVGLLKKMCWMIFISTRLDVEEIIGSRHTFAYCPDKEIICKASKLGLMVVLLPKCNDEEGNRLN